MMYALGCIRMWILQRTHSCKLQPLSSICWCHPGCTAVTGIYMTYSAHQVCRQKLLTNPHHRYDDCINIYVKPVQPKDFT